MERPTAMRQLASDEFVHAQKVGPLPVIHASRFRRHSWNCQIPPTDWRLVAGRVSQEMWNRQILSPLPVCLGGICTHGRMHGNSVCDLAWLEPRGMLARKLGISLILLGKGNTGLPCRGKNDFHPWLVPRRGRRLGFCLKLVSKYGISQKFPWMSNVVEQASSVGKLASTNGISQDSSGRPNWSHGNLRETRES